MTLTETHARNTKESFFGRPLIVLILSVLLWISFLYVQRDMFVYFFEHSGVQFFTSVLFQVQLLAIMWIFLLGLIVDFFGARKGLQIFFVGAVLFFGLALTMNHSLYFAQIALQVSVAVQILLILVIFKALGIYVRGMQFSLSISILYTIFSLLLHFKTPIFFPHLILPNFYRLTAVLLGISIILGIVSCFLWPSSSQERAQYDVEKFIHLLRPIYRLKAWPIMISLGVLLFFVVVFFKLAVLYCFPVLISIDDGYEEAVFLFGLGVIVGLFIYSLIFKNTPYLGRVIGASLSLSIICLLGIGFLSMSEELVWCLVALVGVFSGSVVLLFRLLLDIVGAEAFATACGVSILIGGGSCALLDVTIFQKIHHLPAAHSMHVFYVHLWWVGILLLGIATVGSLLVPNIRLSMPVVKGVHVRVMETLGQYFRGEASLFSAFWQLSIVGRWIVISLLFWTLFFFWLPSNLLHLMQLKGPTPRDGIESWMSIDWYHLLQFGLILSLFGIVMSFFLMVSVWRSGCQSLWIWRYLSRVVVVMVFLRNIILLGGMCAGFYMHFHPEIAQEYLKQMHY